MKIIGHRGARGLARENTIAGLKKALEYDVDELEFDLRVTRDGVVILNHNPYVKNSDDRRLVVVQHTFKELKAAKPDLATFEEVLETIGPQAVLHVEVKPRVPIQPIIKIIQKYLSNGWRAGHFLLASKSQKTLLELHTALPEIGKVVIQPWSGVLATRRARQVNTKRISMNQLWLWRGFIAPMSRRGWQLSAYPLNNPTKARRWAGYGLYAAITDYPDRFKH